MTQAPPVNDPTLQEVDMHLIRPNEPGTGVIVSNEICTASRKAAGYVRHIEIDVSGTPLEGKCRPGQSIGIVPPGVDEKGRPHKVRLYSLASPSGGSDGSGKIYAVTVKRTIDEHWETNKLFLGVASNHLCDCQSGDEVLVTGPAGKRFVLPADPGAHDYVFFATGTGIAPYRGMVEEILATESQSRIALVMGAPYGTDLLYHDYFTEAQERDKRFTYLTAISREERDGHGRMYVQDALHAHRETLGPMLQNERTLLYICGIAGMELGIFQKLATQLSHSALSQYLDVEEEAMASIESWDRRMIHRQVKPTKRVMLEVYA